MTVGHRGLSLSRLAGNIHLHRVERRSTADSEERLAVGATERQVRAAGKVPIIVPAGFQMVPLLFPLLISGRGGGI